jgi:PleD family two-component response regulator
MSMRLCGDVALGGVEAMLKTVDGLLYEAKNAGRNRVCYRHAERAA